MSSLQHRASGRVGWNKKMKNARYEDRASDLKPRTRPVRSKRASKNANDVSSNSATEAPPSLSARPNLSKSKSKKTAPLRKSKSLFPSTSRATSGSIEKPSSRFSKKGGSATSKRMTTKRASKSAGQAKAPLIQPRKKKGKKKYTQRCVTVGG